MPRLGRYPIGTRVTGLYSPARVGTVVGSCNLGVHVEWDHPTPPFRPVRDTHAYWPGTRGAPIEGRTWYCARRGRLLPRWRPSLTRA